MKPHAARRQPADMLTKASRRPGVQHARPGIRRAWSENSPPPGRSWDETIPAHAGAVKSSRTVACQTETHTDLRQITELSQSYLGYIQSYLGCIWYCLFQRVSSTIIHSNQSGYTVLHTYAVVEDHGPELHSQCAAGTA